MQSSTDKPERFGALERDPMATGTPPEDFDKQFLRCTILTGTQIQRRDWCPDQCEGQHDFRCTHHDDLDVQEHLQSPVKVSAPTVVAPAPTLPSESVLSPEAPVEQADAEADVATDSAQEAPQAAAEAMGDADTMPAAVEAADGHQGPHEPVDVDDDATLEADARENIVEVNDTVDVEVEVEADVVVAHIEVDDSATPEPEEAAALEANVVATLTVDDVEVVNHEDDVEAAVPDQGDLVLSGEKATYRKVPLDFDLAVAAVDGAGIDPAEVTDDQIADWHVEAQNQVQHGLARAVLIGRALVAKKSQLRHGDFGNWVVSLGFSKRAGRRYMQLASTYEQNGMAMPLSDGGSIQGALRQLNAAKKKKADTDDQDVDNNDGGDGEPDDDSTSDPDDIEVEDEVPPWKDWPEYAELKEHVSAIVNVAVKFPLERRKIWADRIRSFLLAEDTSTPTQADE